VKQLFYGLYSAAGCDQLAWSATRRVLRIVAYHGVCADHLGNESWVPPFFVTRTAFDEQIAYLCRHATILPLSEAVERLAQNDLPDHAVSITFDDGYANNLHLAYPILKKYRVPATVYLATAYISSGDLFPFDRVQLIASAQEPFGAAIPYDRLVDYRHSPIDVVFERLKGYWRDLQLSVSDEQYETLRPLRPEETQEFDSDIIEFGAHTHNHCILANETPQRRTWEIRESIAHANALAGRPVTSFAYPNGQPGDFGDHDKHALRSAGIHVAVTTSAGINSLGGDALELRRFSIGLMHNSPAFAAEVTGVRALLGRA
jgi:peptidoglycan/xylan/chitin deacetylase (PgdA/CDA1 family)